MSSTQTGIEWCDATWNPVTGCAKVSKGCQFCYAERVFERMTKNPKAPMYHGRKFTDVMVHPERLNDPLKWRKPRRVFVNSMSDLFHEDVPFEFVDRVFAVMALCRQHTFLILTKRPERMREYVESLASQTNYVSRIYDPAVWHHLMVETRIPRTCFPEQQFPIPNVWLGVSVEDQATADQRIPILLQTPAKVRFVSYEPALGPVDFTRIRWARIDTEGWEHGLGRAVPRPDELWSTNNVLISRPADDLGNIEKVGLNWVIAGGESGPNARPSHPDWFRAVRDQCKAAGVPFFFKQWGEWVPEDMVTDADHLQYSVTGFPAGSKTHMIRVGKKRAGRLLDGVEHNEFPAVRT